MMREVLAVIGLASTACLGQVTPIGAFTGDRSEGFTDEVNWGICIFCPSMDLFESTPGGSDPICTATAPLGGNHMHATGSWGFFCSMQPHATPNIFASTGGGGARFTFAPGFAANQFGGYFGTNSNVGGATAYFYDANGNQIGSSVMAFNADCSWNWFGWSITPAAAAVEIVGNYSQGAYVMMDDLEWSQGSTCYPDCEEDGDLDVFDFLCFQGAYANQDPYADCEKDGDWDVFDFLCFQGQFANGCN